MMRRIVFFVLLLTWTAWAQPERYVLSNGVIHTATEEPFSGFVVVNGDKIEAVGKGIAPAENAIDLQGAHLYPGLIDADSALGLVEIESLRATRDHEEVGILNPNLVARLGFRAESDTVSVARSQGVLYSGVNPRGSLISGQGSVMRLWGWTWEDMTLVPAWAMSVDWPSLRVSVSETDGKKKKEALKKIGEQLFFLREAFEQARTYADGSVQDVKWSALKPYAKSEAPVLFRVSGKEQIQSVLDWSEKTGVKPILAAGRDVHLFAKELAKRDIPVIYYSLFNQNPEEWQRYDLHYRVPKLLTDAGVKVALSANGLAFDVRELRDLAGRARAFGLNDVQALQTVTLNPAKILGVADQIGSIEVGKQASFVLCQGDILEVAPEVIRAWGDGREIELKDRQKELYRKYRERVLQNSGRARQLENSVRGDRDNQESLNGRRQEKLSGIRG